MQGADTAALCISQQCNQQSRVITSLNEMEAHSRCYHKVVYYTKLKETAQLQSFKSRISQLSELSKELTNLAERLVKQTLQFRDKVLLQLLPNYYGRSIHETLKPQFVMVSLLEKILTDRIDFNQEEVNIIPNLGNSAWTESFQQQFAKHRLTLQQLELPLQNIMQLSEPNKTRPVNESPAPTQGKITVPKPVTFQDSIFLTMGKVIIAGQQPEKLQAQTPITENRKSNANNIRLIESPQKIERHATDQVTNHTQRDRYSFEGYSSSSKGQRSMLGEQTYNQANFPIGEQRQQTDIMARPIDFYATQQFRQFSTKHNEMCNQANQKIRLTSQPSKVIQEQLNFSLQ